MREEPWRRNRRIRNSGRRRGRETESNNVNDANVNTNRENGYGENQNGKRTSRTFPPGGGETGQERPGVARPQAHPWQGCFGGAGVATAAEALFLVPPHNARRPRREFRQCYRCHVEGHPAGTGGTSRFQGFRS